MWRDLERYARGNDIRLRKGKNEARLRTVREDREERQKWDTTEIGVYEEKTPTEQK